MYLFSKSIITQNIEIIYRKVNIFYEKNRKKLEQFNNYYSDWDYRKNIDMTEPHIQSINIKKDTIEIYCEKFSIKNDDYISCDGGTLQDKTLVKRFKKLDLSKYEEVLDFMSAIDSKINWDKVTNR